MTPRLLGSRFRAGEVLFDEAEAVGANHCPAVDDDTAPDRNSMIDVGSRINDAVLTENSIPPNRRGGVNFRAAANLHVVSNVSARADADAFAKKDVLPQESLR